VRSHQPGVVKAEPMCLHPFVCHWTHTAAAGSRLPPAATRTADHVPGPLLAVSRQGRQCAAAGRTVQGQGAAAALVAWGAAGCRWCCWAAVSWWAGRGKAWAGTLWVDVAAVAAEQLEKVPVHDACSTTSTHATTSDACNQQLYVSRETLRARLT
jgi:hypothetical protein